VKGQVHSVRDEAQTVWLCRDLAAHPQTAVLPTEATDCLERCATNEVRRNGLGDKRVGQLLDVLAGHSAQCANVMLRDTLDLAGLERTEHLTDVGHADDLAFHQTCRLSGRRSRSPQALG